MLVSACPLITIASLSFLGGSSTSSLARASYFDNAGLDEPRNDGTSTTIQGPVPSLLATTWEHNINYFQFICTSQTHTSKEVNGRAQCSSWGCKPQIPFAEWGVIPSQDAV
ncbi:predicted protein [Sclerotinia sclerotiorum 1980 UF-70]|uniref:Uncharacterized protein n=1 Tax=Sclerotinia sclerotiorum (strain ATCC 18683 / 1980 / Ss-1) TaxID=665079 RepID=A7EDZ7_SCLS1|nr:predicted protein [Sclerotinia sclerotiorum 1980 UF-70]EDO01063.1 predicted protein [Sclerotinia sclerotiorum 1980 UF-70]